MTNTLRLPSVVLVPVALLACGLAGCLSPRPDTSRYFTLPPAGSAPATGAPVPLVGLGPVTLPPYLDRNEVATRVSPEQLAYSASDRWAAPLASQVTGVLAEELRARIPAGDVVPWPWPLSPPPDVTVAVDFLRLEADASGGTTLHARWTVTVRGRAPLQGETRIEEPGAAGDARAAVAAMGKALSALAGQLADAARRP
ncbi:MAG TPA: PqiC family protein [Anaeromyxobacteraceae bacterium]|nr:PqiC family protein [Anaeromyxobacteraceae bacterium]